MLLYIKCLILVIRDLCLFYLLLIPQWIVDIFSLSKGSNNPTITDNLLCDCRTLFWKSYLNNNNFDKCITLFVLLMLQIWHAAAGTTFKVSNYDAILAVNRTHYQLRSSYVGYMVFLGISIYNRFWKRLMR